MVFLRVIALAPMYAVIPSFTTVAPTPAVLINVFLGFLRLAIVDHVISDRECSVFLRCRLRVDRGFPLALRGIHWSFRSAPSMPQGRALCLLNCCRFEELSDLISSSSCFRGRRLRHLVREHGGGGDVWAGAIEDRALIGPILNDTSVYVMSPLSGSPATLLTLSLEGVLELAQSASLFIKISLHL